MAVQMNKAEDAALCAATERVTGWICYKRAPDMHGAQWGASGCRLTPLSDGRHLSEPDIHHTDSNVMHMKRGTCTHAP